MAKMLNHVTCGHKRMFRVFGCKNTSTLAEPNSFIIWSSMKNQQRWPADGDPFGTRFPDFQKSKLAFIRSSYTWIDVKFWLHRKPTHIFQSHSLRSCSLWIIRVITFSRLRSPFSREFSNPRWIEINVQPQATIMNVIHWVPTKC